MTDKIFNKSSTSEKLPTRTMSSYFPTMKMKTRLNEDIEDSMYHVHCHAGNLSRNAIMDSLRAILSSRSKYLTGQPVSIADFGTADGQASLSLVNEIIDIVQTDLGKEQSIVVNYNDLPMNDFNRLSKVIQGNRMGSRREVFNNVYTVMIPRTMYEQCLPNNSVDLAISTVSTQYLSRVCQIQNGVFIDRADDRELCLFREQGKADWRNFVISRGRELKPGGFLITVNVSRNNGGTSSADQEGFALAGSFVSDMAREGIITQEEYLATNCSRTEAEFEDPFTSAIPEVVKLGLELVSMRTMTHTQLDAIFDIVNKDEKEKQAFFRRIVDMVYPWMYHVLYDGLSTSRAEEEKQDVIDQYFSKLQAFAFAHSDFKPQMQFTEVVITKCNRN